MSNDQGDRSRKAGAWPPRGLTVTDGAKESEYRHRAAHPPSSQSARSVENRHIHEHAAGCSYSREAQATVFGLRPIWTSLAPTWCLCTARLGWIAWHFCSSSRASVWSAQAEMLALARTRRGLQRVLAPRKQHPATPRRGRPLRRATTTPAASAAGTPGSCFVDRPGPSHGTGARGPPPRDHETVMGRTQAWRRVHRNVLPGVYRRRGGRDCRGSLRPWRWRGADGHGRRIGLATTSCRAGRPDPARSAFSTGASRSSMIRKSLHERHLLTRGRDGAVLLILRVIGGPHGAVVRCR
jgi:hypothetical protein